MPVGLKPFRVKYRVANSEEKEVVVFAYDETTAKSRAVHEGAIDRYETITGAEEVSLEYAERVEKERFSKK